MMNWVTLLDMGLGLGLRNKLTEAVSKNNLCEIKEYISTGMFSIIIIGIVFFSIFYIILQNIDMQMLFNTQELSNSELYNITLLTGVFIVISFMFSIVNQFFYAYQRPSVVGGIQILHNIVMLILVYIISLQTKHNIIFFVLCFGCAVIISRSIFAIYFFTNHKDLIPTIKSFKVKKLNSIIILGIKFFIIQVCCIIGFSSSNIVITQFLGPSFVRNYDIAIKIFSFLPMIQSIVTTSLWSAFTDAYVKKDGLWIKKILKNIYIFNAFLSIIAIGVGLLIEKIIFLWLGLDIVYSMEFIIYVVLYHIILLWVGSFCALINGIGKINIQLIGWILAVIVILPLVYIFINILFMKIEGVMLSYVISIMILCIILKFNINYILKNI